MSGAAVVVAGVAYAGSTYGRITGVRAKTGRVVLRFPHGEYVPVSGNGNASCSSRLLADLGGRGAVKRVVAAVVALLLVALGIGAGVRAPQARAAEDVRGSSTEEFVVTEDGQEPPPPAEATRSRRSSRSSGRLYGYDAERQRVAAFGLRPPFRRIWTFRARKLLEFPPAIAYGRLYFTNNSGRHVRRQRQDRQARLEAARSAAASPPPRRSTTTSSSSRS